jgi:hypothetical protein
VPDLAAAPARAPAGQPPDDLFVLHHEFEDHVEAGAQLDEHLVQRDGLRHRAREPVEQEAVGGVGFSEAVGDHVDGHLVGHELAGVHVALGLDAQRRALRHVGPEDVTGRDLRHREMGGDELRLSALARPWRPDQDEPHAGALRGDLTTVVTCAGTLRSCAA